MIVALYGELVFVNFVEKLGDIHRDIGLDILGYYCHRYQFVDWAERISGGGLIDCWGYHKQRWDL